VRGGSRPRARNPHASLDQFFALQRSRVKAKATRHVQHVRENLGKLEPALDVERRGYTFGGLPNGQTVNTELDPRVPARNPLAW
jgi:hypothetical protein